VIDPPRAFEDVLGEVAGHDAAWVCWEGGGEALVEAAHGTPSRLLLLVGPEGGLTAGEVEAAETAGARRVSLGPRILRAESAGLTALALGQFLFGDLGGRRGPETGQP
jgi:16S rRNA (uracil1498-N3)-methyltransferase